MVKEYLASADAVLEEQSSNAELGLTSAVAQQRLAEVGPNKLKEEEEDPAVEALLRADGRPDGHHAYRRRRHLGGDRHDPGRG